MVASTGHEPASASARAVASLAQGRTTSLSTRSSSPLIPEQLRDLPSGWLDLTSEAIEARREKLRQLKTRQTHLEAGIDRHLITSDARFAKKHGELAEQLCM